MRTPPQSSGDLQRKAEAKKDGTVEQKTEKDIGNVGKLKKMFLDGLTGGREKGTQSAPVSPSFESARLPWEDEIGRSSKRRRDDAEFKETEGKRELTAEVSWPK